MHFLIALILILVGGVVYYTMQGNDTVTAESEPTTTVVEQMPTEELAPREEMGTTPQTEDTASTPTTAPTSASQFEDGAFTTRVTYLTPRRDEYALAVTLTLQNDIITDASIAYSQGAEKDPNVRRFENAFRSEVIGKSLEGLTLSRVGGASLTTGAFNNALDNIRRDAQS